MYQHNFRIAASILLCFLVQTQGADNYTDENRPYEFGFEVEVEGTKQQHRHEEKDKDGIIKGEFGFITADDVYHVTVYATDKDGHFKILSMKNIHLKSTTTSASGTSSSPRQGHALGLPASTESPVTLVTSAPAEIPGVQLASTIAAPFQSQAVPTLTNNSPPQKTVALKPQSSFTPVPEASPVRACSACSLPTSPKPPPPVPQVSNIHQNQQNLFAPAPPSVNSLQPNSGSQPIRSNAAPDNSHLGPIIVTNTQSQPQEQNEAPEYPRFSNQQLNGQLSPRPSAYPLQESPSIQQAIEPSLTTNPQQGVSISDSEQNYPNQQSQSSYPLQLPSVSNKAGIFSQQPSQSSYPGQRPLVQPNPQQTSQSKYPVQGETAPSIPQPNFPQTSQSSYAGPGPLIQPNPQQTSQSTYPVLVPREESAPGILQPNFPQTSQSSYPKGPSYIASIQCTGQQPSQTIYPTGGDSGVRATLEQSNQSTYPIHESSIAGSAQPNSEQQVVFGERAPKQYNGPKESIGPGQQGLVKPKLVSVDMQIVDKNTDIHALKHGEQEGLPAGLSEHDMSRLLYTFNYTVGFHGHFEEGFANGAKKGYYYVTGRNGVRTRIDYVADGTGFHPKVSQEVLDLLSDDVPKPETEKDAKYGLKSYEFKWLYYPVGS